MSDPTTTDAPPAHVGAHYENPSTKPLLGPVGVMDRDGVQRRVWPLLFALVFALIAIGVVLSVMHGSR
jgi:hypothetical protein